jgi:hypothetical protein
MNYPIPASPQEIVALRKKPVTEELVALAIAGIVQVAQTNGQSLDEITAELLAEDSWLNNSQRLWLCDLVSQGWQSLFEVPQPETQLAQV